MPTSIRNEHSFNLFWEKVNRMAADVGVSDPVLPRISKVRYTQSRL